MSFFSNETKKSPLYFVSFLIRKQILVRAKLVFPKIMVLYPKMDGENNGSKPYEQMDDLGQTPLFLETPKY